MMLELLGAVTIAQATPPTGPPYHPSPESEYDLQGFGGCQCGPDPLAGTITTFTDPTNGFTYNARIHTALVYGGIYNAAQEIESAPYGCRREYIRICTGDWSWCGFGPAGWVGEIVEPIECLYWTEPQTPKPPCPSIRIQGMPGQTIRVRCKDEDGCTDTKGLEP